MENIIIGIIFCVLTLICGIISIFQFMEKGILLNNGYIYATEEERKKMDKKPHYKQSGIVFASLSASFLFFGLRFLSDIAWLFVIAVFFMIATLVYAIVSSIRLSK